MYSGVLADGLPPGLGRSALNTRALMLGALCPPHGLLAVVVLTIDGESSNLRSGWSHTFPRSSPDQPPAPARPFAALREPYRSLSSCCSGSAVTAAQKSAGWSITTTWAQAVAATTPSTRHACCRQWHDCF